MFLNSCCFYVVLSSDIREQDIFFSLEIEMHLNGQKRRVFIYNTVQTLCFVCDYLNINVNMFL